MRVLVTGGSGFIGTNLIERLIKSNSEILSIDIVEPKLDRHKKFWQRVDIRDRESVMNVLLDFQPEIVIHLAAKTDLKGKTLTDYDANISGVANLLYVLGQVPTLKRAIFASSMYVCKPGYIPKSFEDYAPHTLYGESKVETERIIKTHDPRYVWSIVRPTSIWGPWFGEPYYNFFKLILRRMYFHMGEKACRKTYGYIENVIYQIMSILGADKEKVNKQVFYLGDYEPYNITEWANEIAKEAGIRIPTVPFFCFVCLGWLGDILKLFGITFPMTSFRLHNMTTDNIHNLDLIRSIAPSLPVNRIDGTKKTIEWIQMNE